MTVAPATGRNSSEETTGSTSASPVLPVGTPNYSGVPDIPENLVEWSLEINMRILWRQTLEVQKHAPGIEECVQEIGREVVLCTHDPEREIVEIQRHGYRILRLLLATLTRRRDPGPIKEIIRTLKRETLKITDTNIFYHTLRLCRELESWTPESLDIFIALRNLLSIYLSIVHSRNGLEASGLPRLSHVSHRSFSEDPTSGRLGSRDRNRDTERRRRKERDRKK